LTERLGDHGSGEMADSVKNTQETLLESSR
jgi:hypothetical protein